MTALQELPAANHCVDDELPRVSTPDGIVRGVTAREALRMKILDAIRAQHLSRKDLFELCAPDGFSAYEVGQAIEELCQLGLATHHEKDYRIHVFALEPMT